MKPITSALQLPSCLSFMLEICLPATVILPCVGVSIPPSILRIVDFPAPDWPSMTTNYPSSIVKLTWSTAVFPPLHHIPLLHHQILQAFFILPYQYIFRCLRNYMPAQLLSIKCFSQLPIIFGCQNMLIYIKSEQYVRLILFLLVFSNLLIKLYCHICKNSTSF